ncbi:uncharacterized protein LOC106130502 [Amyelois transitella]|uniref:uncharacterized protein LOC106130502 n=1 Tax=Amyelois transitella TaxID=680683 RepID=UPI00067E1254|nr:uncharacterized protein LOC106130502 [Amyelois transitella]
MRTIYEVCLFFVTVGFTSCTIGGSNYMESSNLKLREANNNDCNPLYWYPRHIPEHCLVFLFSFVIGITSCSIAGVNYIDMTTAKSTKTKNDECNPLYWYPRHMPDHCYVKDPAPLLPQPIPIPIPVQMPPVAVPYPPPQPYPYLPMPLSQPVPWGSPSIPMAPQPMGYPQIPWAPPSMPTVPQQFPVIPPQTNPTNSSCFCPPCLVPGILFPPPPVPTDPCQCPPCPPCPPPPLIYPQEIPYGIPLNPTLPMLPQSALSYLPPARPPLPPPIMPAPVPNVGMVPGIPGIVSKDGGINVLPFSDAYADILEKHKNKQFRRKYSKLIKDYERKRRY